MREASGSARGAAHPGRRAGRRALARAPAGRLRARGGRGGRRSAPTGRARTPRCRCASSCRAGSARCRPTDRRAVERLAPARAIAAGARADRPRAASSATPTPASRGPSGSGCRSARSPTPRTARWRSTCCAAATPRRTCRMRPSIHSHDYTLSQQLRRCFDEWRGLREVYGWREPLAAAPSARPAARSARRSRPRAGAGGRACAGRVRPCSPRPARNGRCGWQGLFWARAPTGCRRARSGCCRSSGAPDWPPWTSMHPRQEPSCRRRDERTQPHEHARQERTRTRSTAATAARSAACAGGST